MLAPRKVHGNCCVYLCLAESETFEVLFIALVCVNFIEADTNSSVIFSPTRALKLYWSD